MARKLSHIGIAVKSLSSSAAVFSRLLEIEDPPVENVPDQQVNIAFFRIGEVSLELTEPMGPQSPISKFLDKRGEGVHHLSFEVDDLEGELRRLRNQGFQLIDERPRQGGGGHRIAFLHPRSTNGVLIELCERTPAQKG